MLSINLKCSVIIFILPYLINVNNDSTGDGDDDFDDDASKHLSSGMPIPGRTRTLIVSRDPVTGYGLTLSGDQPVFVQTVKPGGAADRAGVRENDLILKVNGQPVVIDASHNEVVAMIQGKHKILNFFE
jgi:predicted metalloprotease with PDZ domain